QPVELVSGLGRWGTGPHEGLPWFAAAEIGHWRSREVATKVCAVKRLAGAQPATIAIADAATAFSPADLPAVAVRHRPANPQSRPSRGPEVTRTRATAQPSRHTTPRRYGDAVDCYSNTHLPGCTCP